MLFRVTIAVLAIIAAGLIGWRVLVAVGDAPEQVANTPTTPAGSNYYMRDATIYQMDENGQLAYRMQLGETLHFPDTSARLHDIQVGYKGKAKTHWTLQAADGRVPPNSRDIELIGGVTLRLPQLDGQTVVVHTDHAWVRTQKEIVETRAHVTATSPGRTVEADGLTIDLDNNQLKLLDNVQTRYNP